MDEETLWILKKLSAREISAKSASRIIKALETLSKYESGELVESDEQITKPVEEEETSENFAETTNETENIVSEDSDTDIPDENTKAIAVGEDIFDEKLDNQLDYNKQKANRNVITAVQENTDIAQSDTEDDNIYEDNESDNLNNGLFIDVLDDEDNNIDDEINIAEADTEIGVDTQSSYQEPSLGEETKIPVKTEPCISEEPCLDDLNFQEITESLIEENGMFFIMDVQNGVDVLMENLSGNIKIQSWDKQNIRIQGNVFSVYQAKNTLKIKSDDELICNLPKLIVNRTIVNSNSGNLDIEDYPGNLFIHSDNSEVSIINADGYLKVDNPAGNTRLERCQGQIRITSNTGDIEVFGTSDSNVEIDKEMLILDSSDLLDEVLDDKLDINIETKTSKVLLSEIIGNMKVKNRDGDIQITRCKGKKIELGSSGGNLNLNQVSENISIETNGGSIDIEDFFGKVSMKTDNSDISIRNSGDAEINIESDNGNIVIEDCYADAYIDSGVGDVTISGGNLSFGSMGKVDTKMKSGNAFLSRRSFEDIKLIIEKGKAEINMEKLNSGGTSQVSVYRGDINLGISPDFACDLIAHGSKKRINVELPIEVIERDRKIYTGKLNGGGARVELVAPDGDINVKSL